MAAKATPSAPPDLEGRIDALYERPPAEFTAARNALARSLPKPEAARIKQLQKPTVVPWAVNQVYWHARSIWDRLIEAGEALRKAQIAALEKPGTTDARVRQTRDRVREATEAHRKAVSDAVHQALRLSGQAGLHPQADLLTRMLEALSLTADPPAVPGRLTDVVQPAGFEALFGVVPSAAPVQPAKSSRSPEARGRPSPAPADAERRAAESEHARLAVHRERLRVAVQAVTEAREKEKAANRAAEQAEREVRQAELALDRARKAVDIARKALERAVDGRKAAEETRARLASEA